MTVDPEGVVEFTAELVRSKSVLGNEGAAAESVVRCMKALGYDTAFIDEAGNAVGEIRGAHPGPRIVFDGHLDTVDVQPRDAWTHDPFGAEISDGRMYGRGTSDMKGAVAAMVFGAALCDRERLRGSLVVSASVGEELIEGAALKPVLDRYPADLVVIGEASDLKLVNGGRGRAEVLFRTHGTPSHASAPHLGSNAVHTMRRVVEQVEAIPVPSESPVGPGVLALTAIVSDPYPAHSVIPSGCEATYERRLVPGETLEQVMGDFRAACDVAGAPETTVELATIDYTSYNGWHVAQPKWLPAWWFSAEQAEIAAARRSLQESGFEAELASYQFCTNAAYSAGEAGIPTIGLGPSNETLAHIVDESIALEELVRAVHAYAAVGLSLSPAD
ncbi:MAG: YgeY family selenium metabolism-linked hydrolase [Acidobacteriota bacterium]